ncbi:hypothetical protein FKW77_000251 [Venturia effusa]|uniref:C-CAP/cofactor C-like domain-containing protein n=1 Tax=Venturia effusa TaxID=50376 RepID=A0A517LQH4_9PEZI|nr:hypothetical protein FKW77_000251 [Venturia effusa]
MASSVPDSSEPGFQDRFFDYFKHETTTLQEQIGTLSQISSAGTARLDAVNRSLASIARLQREVSDASSQLPAHNQKSYSDQLKQLNERLQKAREAFAPRQKFSFKNARKITSAASVTPITSAAQQFGNTSSKSPPSLQEEPSDEGKYNLSIRSSPSKLNRRPSFTNAASLNIFSQKDIHISIPPSAENAITTSTIHDINNCVIDISFLYSSPGLSFATMSITNISGSLILAGKVKGAIHITGMKNSVVVASTGQLRMHQCENVSVYLHCFSDPIIEHCKDVKFGPLPEVFLDHAKHETKGMNRWNQVQDFQWIKAEHSPNWSEIPTEGRVADSSWKEVVGADEGVEIDEIMQKIRVA